jgi:hypothetical protein
MKLSVKGFALAAGIVWGLAVFVATLISLGHTGAVHGGILSHIYFGYTVSVLGSVIGLVWGFVTGLIAGACFAWLYNSVGS